MSTNRNRDSPPSVLDYSAIQPARMAAAEATATISHSNTSWISGRAPTCLSIARETPLPIRYKVAVNPMIPPGAALLAQRRPKRVSLLPLQVGRQP